MFKLGPRFPLWRVQPHIVFSVIAVDGVTLRITFDRVVTGTGAGWQTSTNGGSSFQNATYSSGSGTNLLIFTTGATILTGQTVLLKYTGTAYTGPGLVLLPAVLSAQTSNSSIQ